MNSLAVFAMLLAFAAPTMSTQPSSQPRASQGRLHANASLPSTPIANNQATSYDKEHTLEKPQGWSKLVAWPEGITVWAIMLTLGAIVWQTWETRKAAVAARDSVLVQEAAYKQWLEFRNWDTSMNTIEDGLTVTVDLKNKTNFPLTLIRVDIALGGLQGTDSHLICLGKVMAPEESVKMSVHYPLTTLSEPNYQETQLGILITGHSKFISVIGRTEESTFKGLLMCGPHYTEFQHVITSEDEALQGAHQDKASEGKPLCPPD